MTRAPKCPETGKGCTASHPLQCAGGASCLLEEKRAARQWASGVVCPDCGAPLMIAEWQIAGRLAPVYVAKCMASGCRITNIPGVGASVEKAQDNLFVYAESHGYVRAIAARLQALAEELGEVRQ